VARSSRSTDLLDLISIELRKAGLAPAFLFAVLFVLALPTAAITARLFLSDAFSSREPVSTPHQVRGRLSLESAISQNYPLMACTEHWKSPHVLPMFRTHPLASDPRLPEDARLNAARSTRLGMPIWMK
jgi:hypothetical protein